ncbi:MAG: hypothetical protein ABIF08_01400 [Nanoarchaeota archaeon]
MKKQTESQLDKKSKEKGDRKEAKSDKPEAKKPTVKKWKGKDWFTVLSPKMFGEKIIAETPCTDPKNLINRNVDVNLSDIIGHPTKQQMKIVFKIVKIEGKNAMTRFNGYTVPKEFMMRSVRKRSQKVTLISYFTTKDGWKLQLTITAILNNNIEANIQRKVRNLIEEMVSGATKKSKIDDFISSLIAGNIQRSIKKEGSKIYPVKFAEIEKVEVIKVGE